MRSVRIDINLGALRHNLAVARSIASTSRAKVFSVVKSNAYGHGIVECAQALAALTDGFAVVVPGEAVTLREAGITCPILVLQGVQQAVELRQAQQLNLQLGIHSEHQLRLLASSGLNSQQAVKVWLKVDSGMGRLGFLPERAKAVIQTLQAMDGVELVGSFTHFSCADELQNSYTQQQTLRFKNALDDCGLSLSLANSSATLAWPETHADWVRPGIMLYGANPLWPHELSTPLRPVMTVSAPIIALSDKNKGDTIGYGNTFRCPRDMRVAVVAIGYGDGYPRHIRTTATVLLGGQRCSILGRVSMDSLVIDVSDLDHIEVGDSVILWGEGLPVEEVALNAGTISYELLCQIRGRAYYSEA